LLSILVGIGLDVFQKYLGENLPSVEITFLRFFFGTVTLLPVLLLKGKGAFRTSYIGMHISRGLLLFLGIALWCYGLTIIPISTVTMVGFTIPLFTLVLAVFVLKESVRWPKWVATFVGFIGMSIIFNPTKMNFNPMVLLVVLAAVFFAVLDIMNKKYVIKESTLSMLFYTALFTMLFSFVPAMYVWEWPSFQQFFILFLLGLGANGILFCILKAFSHSTVSTLVPFRYVEFLFSVFFGIVFFNEFPPPATLIGALFIVPATLLVAYFETRGVTTQ
jgi:S-adenosylmethionine uptake transporter